MIRKVFTKLGRRWRLIGIYVNTVLLDRRKADRAYLLNGFITAAETSRSPDNEDKEAETETGDIKKPTAKGRETGKLPPTRLAIRR
jgi:hypothetical protein